MNIHEYQAKSRLKKFNVSVPDGVLVSETDDIASASKVTAAIMNQIDVLDFSLAEPDLSMVVKQIYRGALQDKGVKTKD